MYNIGIKLANSWSNIGSETWGNIGLGLVQYWLNIVTLLGQCWTYMGLLLGKYWYNIGTSLVQAKSHIVPIPIHSIANNYPMLYQSDSNVFTIFPQCFINT